MVSHTYPSVLEDLQQLDQLHTIEKVEIQEILKDIATLQEGINLVKNQSSLKPFCDEDLYGMRWMCVLSRFPQKVGPKVGDMSTRFEVLRSLQSRVKDAFRDLLAWFGESEKDYTENTFFKVIIEFYKAFNDEMKELEEKKKKSEEIKRQQRLQETLLNAASQQHAMDDFQHEMHGKSSRTMLETFRQSIRGSDNRKSTMPMPFEPISVHGRSSNFRQLGAPINRLSYMSTGSDGMNNLSDILSSSQEDSDYSYDSLLLESRRK